MKLDIVREESLSFSEREVEEFRIFSGDNNKLHCDLFYAELNGFPQKVVYGCLILKKLVRIIGASTISKMRADFVNPIFVEEIVRVLIMRQSERDLRVEILGGEQTKVTMNVELLNLDPVDFLLKVKIESEIFSLLGMMSESIGMVEPGDLALIRSLSFCRNAHFFDYESKTLWERSSDRFGVYHTKLSKDNLVLECFAIKRNFQTVTEIFSKIVESLSNFERTRTPKKIIVYGITGTMGLHLGLLCAAIGHHVTGVYRSSKARAKELNEFSQRNDLQIQLKNNSDYQAEIENFLETDGVVVLYCSSPQIKSNFSAFDYDLYENYKSIYVKELEAIMDKAPTIRRYFIPSTVFLNSNSPYQSGHKEYCKAKANQEELVKRRSGITYLMPRVEFFASRHTQMTFNASEDVLKKLQIDLVRWLESLD